jgi:hypothetical protein
LFVWGAPALAKVAGFALLGLLLFDFITIFLLSD